MPGFDIVSWDKDSPDDCLLLYTSPKIAGSVGLFLVVAFSVVE